MKKTCSKSWRRTDLVLLTLLCSLPLFQTVGAPRPEAPHGGEAPHGAGAPHGGPPRGGAEVSHGGEEGRRTTTVERPYHGSIRHSDFGVQRGYYGNVHRNYDVDVNHGYGPFWGGFVTGAIVGALPYGYQTVYSGGVPYYYADGAYYQQGPSGYTVVNPPVGAALPGPPAGSIPIMVNGQPYYYADGTFYVQQGEGYAIVPAPLGVTVPELPSAATQTVINGNLYYQFNGVYYQPVIQNGVTMYMTVAPQ